MHREKEIEKRFIYISFSVWMGDTERTCAPQTQGYKNYYIHHKKEG